MTVLKNKQDLIAAARAELAGLPRRPDGSGRDPRKLRLNNQLSRWTHRSLMDASTKREIKSKATKKRWVDPFLYTMTKQRKIARRLRIDLRILDRVIKGIRGNLLKPEKSRISALASYHRRKVQINKARRVHGRQENPNRLSGALHALFGAREQEFKMAIRRVEGPHKATQKRIFKALRRRFEKGFKRKISSRAMLELTGTTLERLKAYLEGNFKPGMTWENYGFYGWHIDHIRPCSSFDATDPRQRKACFHWTNLQPLWGKDNMAKSDKWDVDF